MPHTTTVVQFKLEDFEGPLDLLLALIADKKKSILDIDILLLIDQYLEVMGHLNADNLDDASEFISMASHLVRMKSVLLLPRSDEAERMEEELKGQLIEYELCKQIAGKLRLMAEDVYIAVRAPLPLELDMEYKHVHSAEKLADAYHTGMGRRKSRRAPQREEFEEIVASPFVSVSGRVIHVLRQLVTRKVWQLHELFSRRHTRGETIATFMAVLELIHEGRIHVDDNGKMKLNKKHNRKRAS